MGKEKPQSASVFDVAATTSVDTKMLLTKDVVFLFQTSTL
jgi:hypothetical protein